MNEADVKVDKQGRFQAYISQGVREGALIGLVALCVYLFMALFSYNPDDPGWANTGHNQVATNYAGVTGAWFANVLFYFFGYVAYLFPLLISYKAWLQFHNRHKKMEFHWPLFLVRSIGFFLVLVSATGLLSIYSIAGLPISSGGVLGQEISASMLSAFNLSGSSLLLVAIFLFSITVFTGLSWLKLMDSTGGITLKFVNKMIAWFKQLKAFVSARIQASRERKAQKRARNPNDNIANIDPPILTEKVTASESAAVTENRSLIKKLQRKVGIGKTGDNPNKGDDLTVAKRVDPVMGRHNEQSSDSQRPSSNQSASDTIFADNNGRSVQEEKKGKGLKIAPFLKKSSSAESKRVAKEKQGKLFAFQEGRVPPISLLDAPEKVKEQGYSTEVLEHLSRLLEEKLADFGVSIEVVEVNPGPVITRFEIQPAPGVKVSRITNLAKDLARSLAVLSVRVVEVIPGKSVVGIEIPNEKRQMVLFSEVLSTKDFDDSQSPLTLALGNDIAGDPIVVDLAKMPHLLVAGTTGSGKSVGVNAMILSMLYKSTPEEVRLIMIDPKMLELSIYDGIPHLLTPVVTDMKEAANSLRWCVAEMERRYRLMAALGVRNLGGYNRKVKDGIEAGEPLKDPIWKPDEHLLNGEEDRPELTTLPCVVVVVDEFADMMMIVGKKVEELIARIAQKARAAGIHLILATQRPSVDVITGLIKANVPTRIAFQVSSRIDSRTILDQGGAEQLLGHGDMLYMPPGTGLPIRVHGAFVSDDEVHRTVADWKQRGEPEYIDEILSGGDTSEPIPGLSGESSGDSEQDALFDEAIAFVTETRRASISSVQRKLKIGYNRAANLVEAMEAAGVVSEAGHNGAREVLAPPPPKD
ncbi:DNA translocase FtsK [Alkalimarinus alittae]|uniref:DNA translocase FtsK n=1 Tax=Alkalimarinus alittae TaxID=2961619 RepID=A0ABY6N6Y1_9ALTE|nr:DNA translocase FtsK [Alkalimarinus alittae]UZE97863.1 DNA translocase FtsK 4TM domain-containing protein [Alkalimarinus alittae]